MIFYSGWFGGQPLSEAYYPCLYSSLCSLTPMSMVETATSTTVSAIEPLDSERCSAVRFETQCVVIPDPAHRFRRPRVVTKSLALPLWKRWSSSSGPSISAPPEDTSEESHLVLRVPVPTYVSSLVDIIRVPNSAPVFRSSVTRRLAPLITHLSRLVLYIVLSLLVLLVLALPRVDIPMPHGNTPLLRLAQTSSQYPCVLVVQHACPSLMLLSSAVMRGQSICRVLPRGPIA